MNRLLIHLLVSLIIVSSCHLLYANENLLNLYRYHVPFTFGLLVDLHSRIFTMQHSTDFCQTKFYIGESGSLQLHLNFIRDKLPADKKLAEKTIEETAINIKNEAEELARSLWITFLTEIPAEVTSEGTYLVNALVFLDGTNVGFNDGERFLWRRIAKDNRPITN